MATLTVTALSAAGVALTYGAADPAGDEVPNTDGRTILLIRNGHATLPRTVTIVTTETRDGLAVADRAIAVAALATMAISKLIPTIYNNQSTGRVALTYSDSGADLTLAAVKP